jgi:hypothetical protein
MELSISLLRDKWILSQPAGYHFDYLVVASWLAQIPLGFFILQAGQCMGDDVLLLAHVLVPTDRLMQIDDVADDGGGR